MIEVAVDLLHCELHLRERDYWKKMVGQVLDWMEADLNVRKGRIYSIHMPPERTESWVLMFKTISMDIYCKI